MISEYQLEIANWFIYFYNYNNKNYLLKMLDIYIYIYMESRKLMNSCMWIFNYACINDCTLKCIIVIRPGHFGYQFGSGSSDRG